LPEISQKQHNKQKIKMQNRLKSYDIPHKALRNALSQLSLLAGKTDFSDKKEVEQLYHLGSDVFLMLNKHAEDENEVVLADLELRCPGASAHDTEDHAALHVTQHQLEELLKKIYTDVIAGKDATADGAEFYLSFSEYHGIYLEHTAEEERVTQPLLWKYFTDEELIGHRGRIMSKMPPEMLLKWFRFILPAQNPIERAAMLTGIKQMAPPPFFAQVMELAQKIISPQELEKLQLAIGS
jgi:hemerythrin HHE cation binding domain-containing protein